jgi:ribose 5-phosphate isomerase B
MAIDALLPVALASDHGGLDLKEQIKAHLEGQNIAVLDLGTHDTASVDYPDYAQKMAHTLKAGQAATGILICGTGIGISIAANRFAHVRAALVHDHFTAKMCREHNNANVLVLGGRTTGIEVAKECADVFLNTAFEGGRHANRLAKIDTLNI